MAFKIEERFEVQAPVDRVWKYLIDPNGHIVHSYSPQIDLETVYFDIKNLLIKHHLIDKTEL